MTDLTLWPPTSSTVWVQPVAGGPLGELRGLAVALFYNVTGINLGYGQFSGSKTPLGFLATHVLALYLARYTRHYNSILPEKPGFLYSLRNGGLLYHINALESPLELVLDPSALKMVAARETLPTLPQLLSVCAHTVASGVAEAQAGRSPDPSALLLLLEGVSGADLEYASLMSSEAVTELLLACSVLHLDDVVIMDVTSTLAVANANDSDNEDSDTDGLERKGKEEGDDGGGGSAGVHVVMPHRMTDGAPLHMDVTPQVQLVMPNRVRIPYDPNAAQQLLYDGHSLVLVRAHGALHPVHGLDARPAAELSPLVIKVAGPHGPKTYPAIDWGSYDPNAILRPVGLDSTPLRRQFSRTLRTPRSSQHGNHLFVVELEQGKLIVIWRDGPRDIGTPVVQWDGAATLSPLTSSSINIAHATALRSSFVQVNTEHVLAARLLGSDAVLRALVVLLQAAALTPGLPDRQPLIELLGEGTCRTQIQGCPTSPFTLVFQGHPPQSALDTLGTFFGATQMRLNPSSTRFTLEHADIIQTGWMYAGSGTVEVDYRAPGLVPRVKRKEETCLLRPERLQPLQAQVPQWSTNAGLLEGGILDS
jgi:hypothetical protein